MADQIDVAKLGTYAITGGPNDAITIAKIGVYLIVDGNAPPPPPTPRRRQCGVAVIYGPPPDA